MNNNENIKSFSIKRLKIGTYGIAVTVIVIALAVVLNLIVSTLPTTLTHISTDSVDFYEVGEESLKILDAVSEDVTIYHIVEKGNEDPLMEELLSRYEGLCSKLTVKTVDPGTNPTFVQKYTSETVSQNSVIVESPKRSKVVDNSEIYTTEYTEEEQYYMMMGYPVSGTTYFNGELAFTSAIDYVTRAELPTVYTLTGHGETALDATYADYISKENIATAELNLLSAETVPEDCSTLLISVPTGDISTDELDKITAYMDKGGDVVLITDFRNYSSEGMPNIASLAAKAGLRSEDGLVLENDNNRYYAYPYIVIPEIVSSTDSITSKISDTSVNTLFNGAHGITATEEGTATVTSILNTSAKAEVADVNDSGEIVQREDYVTGSAVSIASIADTAVENGDYGDTSSFVWYASSSIVDSSMMNYIGEGNLNVFLATLNHLCEGTTSISILGKSWQVEPLVLSEAQSTTWMVVLTVIVPLAFLGTGFVVWFRRRKK